MPWILEKKQIESCGCIKESYSYDDCRAFSYESKENVDDIKRCPLHQKIHEENEERLKPFRDAEKRRKEAIREAYITEQQKSIEAYRSKIKQLDIQDYIPIDRAIEKYRKQRGISNSRNWILRSLLHYADILHIKKIKNRWMVSRVHVDEVDFTQLTKQISYPIV